MKELGDIVGVHCENHGIVQSRLKELEKTKGRTDIADYSWIHPKEAEAEAVGRILKIAKCADVPVIIVNLSTAAGYREILKAREIGQTVYVETCPEYLLLNEEKYALAAEEARKYVTVPPLETEKQRYIVGCIERRKDSDDSVRSFWIYKRTEKCRRRGFYADAFRYAGSRRTSGAYVAVRSE